MLASTVNVQLRTKDFVDFSHQGKLLIPTANTKDIYELAVKIFDTNYKNDPIRLIGIRLSDFQSSKEEQISLFSEEKSTETVENDEIQRTIDIINSKFGKSLLAPASLKIIGRGKNKKRED